MVQMGRRREQQQQVGATIGERHREGERREGEGEFSAYRSVRCDSRVW